MAKRSSTCVSLSVAPHHLPLPRMARMIAREGNNLCAATDQRCPASVLNMRLGRIPPDAPATRLLNQPAA